MKNIYDLSSRTRLKLIRRLNLECFNCGWDKEQCDIHHIVPRSRGGSNDHSNLTSLCPNCHRLVHKNKINVYHTLEEKVGDKWFELYSVNYNTEKLKEYASRGAAASLETRKRLQKERALVKIDKMKNSGIDFTKRGWVQQIAETFSIPHQHVSKFIRKYDPDFYFSVCKRKGV